MQGCSVTDISTDDTKRIILYLAVLLAHIYFKSRNLSHGTRPSVSLM